MKLLSLNTKGFSILHVLPLLLVVGIVGFTGYKIMKPTKALAPPLWCTSSYWNSGTTVYATTFVKNATKSVISPAHVYTGYHDSSTHWTNNFYTPKFSSGASYTKNTTIRAFGRHGTVYATSGMYSIYGWQNCSGSRYISF